MCDNCKLEELEYENIHSHSMYSNIYTSDSIISKEDIAKRASELGHKTLSLVEHGYFSNIFEVYPIAEKYNLKMIFGSEVYFVKNRHEKDNTNAHLLVVAKNSKGKRELTNILSEANKTGFHYRPRIDEELLFSLSPENVIVTTACLASPIRKYKDYADEFITKCKSHFGENFYLEVQPHTMQEQVEFNMKLQEYRNKYDVPFILGIDTHYIYPEDSEKRDLFLRGKNMYYPDEEGMIIDYPTTGDIISRLKNQGVLKDSEIREAFNSTLVAREFEDIAVNDEIKMPSLYPELSHQEKVGKLQDIIRDAWREDKKHIDREKWKEYQKAIKFETKIVSDTKMEDYFLLNQKIIDKAVNEYGGVLTRTGRGSGPSFYINKLLGFTEVDRIDAPIELYPTRFMSKSRILETKSLPDIDLNTADPKPFIRASKDILGEDNVYLMTAYGTMKDSEAFRNYCRALDLDKKEFNEVGKNLDSYRNHKKWGPIIKESQMFLGVIDSVSPHPCFTGDTLVMTDNGFSQIKDIQVGDRVLTHENRFDKVLETINHDSTDIYELKVMGVPQTKVTGAHPYYVRTKNYKNNTFTTPHWKTVDEIEKGDYLGFAINQESKIPYYAGLPTDMDEFWWVIGRYIGDGWRKNRRPNHNGEYLTIVCVNKKDNELMEVSEKLSKLSEYFKFYITEERTTYRINIPSKSLYEFVKQFGKGAKNKRLTKDVFDLPRELLSSFIEGYISADGSTNSRGKTTFTTISKELAYGISSCVNKAYHRHLTLVYTKRKDNYLEGRLLKGNWQYQGTFSMSKRKGEQAFYENGYIWTPFREKTKLGERSKVYNLEVENDNSYTANTLIVHNCATLILDKPISEEVGVIKVGDVYTALIDSDNSDKYNYLKNDFLTVTVWDIIAKVYDKIGMEIDDVRSLIRKTEGDKKVWSLYEKGLVSTLNQAGTESGKPQVMQYKPTSIRELSGWVSAIRPAFSSMKQYFLNREEFSYDIPEFDELLKSSDNFILYQENIMTVLQYVGFPEDETYGLLKAIAKKKEGIIEPIRKKFIDGFIEKTGSEEKALRVWQIVEDAVGYGFNSSHAYSVALDSLYGAYLKANFPLDYYSVVLNIYQGKTTKTAEIEQELESFGIQMDSVKFGESRADYSANYDTKVIYKGLQSIKFLNRKISDELYELSQEKDYIESNKSYLELFIDIIERTSVDSRQMKILIGLDYFSDFGESELLLNVWNTITGNGFPQIVDAKYIDKRKHPLKYTKALVDKTKEKRITNMKEYIEKLESKPPAKRGIYEKIKFEIEYMGYAVTRFKNIPNSYALVMDVNLKATPVIDLYQLKSGKMLKVKIKKNRFYDVNENPIITVGNLIKVSKTHLEHGWRMIDGKWEKNESVTWRFIDKLAIVSLEKED